MLAAQSQECIGQVAKAGERGGGKKFASNLLIENQRRSQI